MRKKLIFIPEQILAYTGSYAEGCLIIDGENKTLLTDRRYFFAVKNSLLGEVEVVCSNSLFDDLEERINGEDLLVDFSTLTHQNYLKLKSFCGDLVDATDLIGNDLAIKSQKQLEKIRQSCSIAERAYIDTLPYIKQGVSELDISSELEYRFKKFGADTVSFDTIVAFGKNSAVPHHKTGTTKLVDGDVVLMDFGCKFAGFCSDITRTMMFKGQPSKKFLSSYNAVLKAHLMAEQGIKEGMLAKEADALCRQILKNYNLEEYFTHSLGHGIGVFIHENPYLSKRSEQTLKNGMVFSIEPGVYFDGEFGIRIENTYEMIDKKAKSMVSIDRDLLILE